MSSRPPSHHGSLHQLAQPAPSPRSRPSSGIFDPMPKSSSLKRPKNSSDSDSIYKDEEDRNPWGYCVKPDTCMDCKKHFGHSSDLKMDCIDC